MTAALQRLEFSGDEGGSTKQPGRGAPASRWGVTGEAGRIEARFAGAKEVPARLFGLAQALTTECFEDLVGKGEEVVEMSEALVPLTAGDRSELTRPGAVARSRRAPARPGIRLRAPG